MTRAAVLATTGGALALGLGLALGGGKAAAGETPQFTPDFGTGFAIEGQHLVHFAVRLKGIDAGRLDSAGKAGLRAAMWPRLWKYACSLPQGRPNVFEYVRHPSGVIELDMMDAEGFSITQFKVRWPTCQK
jgi:hypothetical protein